MGYTIAIQIRNYHNLTNLNLAGKLWLLAGFGLTHGVVDLAIAFLPVRAEILVIDWMTSAQIIGIGISFVFLCYFGLSLLEIRNKLINALPTAIFLLSMDIRLQDYIYGKSTVHGAMACFECHDSHNVGNDPNNKSIKGNSPIDSCVSCHGDNAEAYIQVLNGRTGWDSYGFGNWGNEGGRAGSSSHVFNFDEEGRSFALTPDKYVWALKPDGNASEKDGWAPIWPWEQNYFEAKGQRVEVGEAPWNQ